MLANYFYIDGSALTAQIRYLQRIDATFADRRLCPKRFLHHLIHALPELHRREYKRATFYFPSGDETAVHKFLVMPDIKRPSEIRDLHFKFCGQKLKKSAEFLKFVEEHVPAKFQNRFAKSEKGIDIEMCCDALKLASASRIERLFLFTNDADFIPFCRVVKEFGANISIIHLSDAIPPNGGLLREVDSYDVVPPEALQGMFLPPLAPLELPLEPAAAEASVNLAEEHSQAEAAKSEKPPAAPSDLVVNYDGVVPVADE